MCNDHDYCCLEMPNEYNKILKYNHREKSLNAPTIIYTDFFIYTICNLRYKTPKEIPLVFHNGDYHDMTWL